MDADDIKVFSRALLCPQAINALFFPDMPDRQKSILSDLKRLNPICTYDVPGSSDVSSSNFDIPTGLDGDDHFHRVQLAIFDVSVDADNLINLLLSIQVVLTHSISISTKHFNPTLHRRFKTAIKKHERDVNFAHHTSTILIPAGLFTITFPRRLLSMRDFIRVVDSSRTSIGVCRNGMLFSTSRNPWCPNKKHYQSHDFSFEFKKSDHTLITYTPLPIIDNKSRNSSSFKIVALVTDRTEGVLDKNKNYCEFVKPPCVTHPSSYKEFELTIGSVLIVPSHYVVQFFSSPTYPVKIIGTVWRCTHSGSYEPESQDGLSTNIDHSKANVYDKDTRKCMREDSLSGLSSKQSSNDPDVLIGTIPTVRGISSSFISTREDLLSNSNALLPIPTHALPPLFHVGLKLPHRAAKRATLLYDHPIAVPLSTNFYEDEQGDAMTYVEIVNQSRSEVRRLAK